MSCTNADGVLAAPKNGAVITVPGAGRWLVPGLNLSLPGSLLAEIEHSALGRPADRRPRPSRLLLVWWALSLRRTDRASD